jgi:hypothetical protein
LIIFHLLKNALSFRLALRLLFKIDNFILCILHEIILLHNFRWQIMQLFFVRMISLAKLYKLLLDLDVRLRYLFQLLSLQSKQMIFIFFLYITSKILFVTLTVHEILQVFDKMSLIFLVQPEVSTILRLELLFFSFEC